MATKLTTPTKVIRYISIGLFLISLACPCYDTDKEVGGVGEGALLMTQGILWFMFISPGFVWLANPLLLFSWIYAGKKRGRSFVFSMIALVIALCFLFYNDIIIDESGSNTAAITAHRIGYWLWVTSIATMLLGNLYLQIASTGVEKVKVNLKAS